uniref:hypothetical protein n=1 Tax=uncultured Caballeronia sp. TaxID=1827198 RepID=UPI0035CB387B
MNAHPYRQPYRRIESLLNDFEPVFAFTAPLPLPPEEFAERVRRIRREAVLAGHDALIIHAGSAGWFHASNPYLRYVCDWMREGLLIVPTDSDKEMVLLSFFTQSVILPPGGEPVGVEQIWQIGAIGREYADRPGSSIVKTTEAAANLLSDLGLSNSQIGRIGDRTSAPIFS